MRLLVNAPTGKQEIIVVGDGGGYFDLERVLWDERIDGELPPIVLGAMLRVGDSLVVDEQRRLAAEDRAFAASAEQLLTAISAECQRHLSALAAGYPDGEVSSWPAQVKEAEQIQGGAQAAAPLLSAIAAARGLPLRDLADRVLAKSAAYAAASGAIIGRRQALEDAVAAAQSAEDLAAIDITAGWPE